MRISILLIIFIIGPKIHGQTDSLEKAIFYNKVQTKEISNFEFSIIGKKWNETLKNIPYPDLSVNSEGKLQYSFITDFQDISGEKLFNRILEWLSITYGLIPAYLYSNPEDGKIICSNSVSIDNNTSVTYTSIYTIKDGSVLMEFPNIGYQVTSAGYYSGDTWIPERTNYYPIDQVFPIILRGPEKWTYYFRIVRTLNDRILEDMNSLNDYIVNYDLRYTY